MDLLNYYISDCSPYIHQLTYDLDEREVIFVFQQTGNSISHKQLIFQDVKSFTEELFEDAFDPDFMDSIVGMHIVSDDIYCIHTEKRELIVEVGRAPIVRATEDKLEN